MASKSVLVRTNERPNNRLECPICKERFWLRCKYDDHVATHEHSRVSCNICSKSFYDQKLLDEHYLTHTNVIKTYNCKECARKFLQKYQLEQHMQFHKPVKFMPFIINKKKSVHFNKVTHVKNIIDETSNSEEFHTSDSEDEEECNISDLEDYLPANKLVQTRSGRVVKRKKLFDEEETEIKHKSPKTEQVYTKRSIITEYKHQKDETPKIYLDAVQKSLKLKQVYAKKSTVTEYNNQKKQSTITDYNSPKKQSSKFSEIDLVRKNIGKELSVVVEKLPDHMFAKYIKKGNVFTENQANFSSTQESPKSFVSVIAKQPNSSVTSVSINSISDKKSNSCKGKPRQLNFENVQKSPKVMTPNLANKPQNSTVGDSINDKRAETTESSKFTSKSIVNNSPSCSKTVGKSSNRNSRTDNLDKSLLSTLSQVSPYKSPTCKEYVYVGSNPDFRKIKQAIEEVNTMSNHETLAQSKRVLNSLNSSISSKNNIQLANNASLTNKSKKSGLKIPVGPTDSQNNNNSQNVNQLNGNAPEEGILEEKIVGECRVVKVTPEYMKKIQRDLLNQSVVPSTPNLRSPSKQMSETVAASHLNFDLSKSSTLIANNHATVKENEKPNAAANISVKANTINNITKNCQGSSTDTPAINSCSKPPKVITLPNKQLREIAFANASFAVSNSNESPTLFTEKHSASNLNKSTTTPAKPSETIREIQKSNAVANTSVEINTTNLPSSMEIPIAKVPGKHLASNLNESVTDCVEGLESQKSNAVANTSIETNNNVMKTCQRSAVETPIVYPSSSSVEHPKVLPIQCFQLPSNQMTWSTCANGSPTVTNSSSPFLARKQGTVNESQVSITSVKPYKVNNSKQAYQNNLVQTQVVYPIYLLHTSTPIMQSPNASLLHSEIPTVQSPNVSLVHTQIPNVQSSNISLVHSEVPAEEKLVFTTMQTIQSPTTSVMHSKIEAQQTTKLPIKKNKTPSKALHVNRNLTLSKRKQNSKKSVFQEPYCFTETSSELNKNLKTYQKVAVENTQMLPQSNLNELQTENIAENSIPECVHELIAEIDDSIKSNNGTCEDNATEDAVSSNLTSPERKTITKKSLLEDPYTFTTDTSFEFNNDNLKTHQKVTVEDTQKLSQSLLNKLLTENIADNSVLESEQEHQNELNDSMKSVNDNFIEDAVNSHVNNNLNVYPSNLIEAILVSHSDEDENKQTSTQTTLNESQTENITMEGFDNSQANPVKSIQQKNHCNDKLHKDKHTDKNENEVEILPEVNRNVAVVDDNKDITKESNEFTPVIVNSFTIDDDSFEKCQLNFFKETAVAPDKNIQVTQQSNMNDLLAVKPTDNSRTKSIGSEIKKRLRSHANKCESDQIDTAITTPNKNKQISLKRTPASSSKTVKKQKVTQKYHEIDEKKSYGIKNPSDFLPNVSLNKNKSKKASSKNNPDNKSPKNNESNKASPKSNPDNKSLKNSDSKEASSKSNSDNKSPKNNVGNKASLNGNSDNKSPKDNGNKEAAPKSNPNNKSRKKNESKETSSKSNQYNKPPKKNENKEAQSKSSPDNKSPMKIPEKLLQRYQAKLEEKERKKKEKYELKKQIKYIQRYLSSPSRDSNEEDFSKGMFPTASISVNDIAKICGKCVTETNKQPCVSQEIGTISTMLNNLKDSTDSSFSDIGNDSQKKNESESSKHCEETRAIAKARSITLKFNKDLNENESLQLLDELGELIDTYNIGDKCPFLDKTIRFCCLFVDSYKVRQKAISLRNKLKNMKSS